jgi:hypothetical protein
MKKILILSLLISLSCGAVFAQKGKKSDNGNAFSSTTKSEKSNLDREAMVDARQRGYEKQFRHRKFQRGTAMGECPGNPKNKINRRNPYKQERKREDRRKPAKRKK